MKNFTRFSSTLCLFLFITGNTYAAIINVPDPTHTPPIVTIQDGINAAANGDTVLVAPGTYPGIIWIDKSMTVVSASGPSVTIIDGQNRMQGIRFSVGLTNSTVVDGFTITRCTAYGQYGGAVLAQDSSPVIRNCIIQNNKTATAVAARGASTMLIENCILRDNYSSSPATPSGAVYAWGYSSNHSYANPTIVNSVIFNNTIGGLTVDDYANVTVKNCTIVKNTYFGVIFNKAISNSLSITNSILWDNAQNLLGYANVTYTDVPNFLGGIGNINADPKFVDELGGGFDLLDFSPCVDSANGDVATLTDINYMSRHDDGGVTNTGFASIEGAVNYVDMGAYEKQNDSPLPPPPNGGKKHIYNMYA